MSPAYPPEPWRLTGSGVVTAWQVPLTSLPTLPHGARPLALRGRALAVTAFVSYAPSGVLAYDELLAGVAVRAGRAVGLTITDIWVDNAASRAGGRELWGIPKEMASFPADDRGGLPLRCVDGGGAIAAATVTRGPVPALPIPVPVPTRCVQSLDGVTAHTRMRATGRVRPARVRWDLAESGPLAWLRTGRRLLGATVEDFTLVFGPRLTQA